MKTALTLVLLVACGSKQHPAEHHETSPEMTQFEGTLAPHWQAERGPKRMKDTCEAIPAFSADADALAKAKPPQGTDATMWANGTKELTDAVAALDATCKANDAKAFEPAFERVHKGFEGLMAVTHAKSSA